MDDVGVTKACIGASLAVCLLVSGCGGVEQDVFTDRVVEDALSTSDHFDGGTYYQAFRVIARTTGEGIINMEGQACEENCNGATLIDTQLYVKRPNGADVVEDNDSGGGNDARVRFHVDAGDEFRVVATTHVGSQTGRFRLTVSENLKIIDRLNH